MIHKKNIYVKVKNFLVLIQCENPYLNFEVEGNYSTLATVVVKKGGYSEKVALPLKNNV